MTDKQVLNAALRAQERLHRAEGYNPSGGHYKAVDANLDLIQAEMKRRLKPPPARWENVGPFTRGGISVLDWSLTHDTSGIKLYPALDFAWSAGMDLIAPERVVVFKKDTSASPGEAMYLKGDSELEYWLAHIIRDYPLGKVFQKGEKIGDVLDQSGTDHAHVGVNGEFYLGMGKEFKWGNQSLPPHKRRYTTGAPTIRTQLLALNL